MKKKFLSFASILLLITAVFANGTEWFKGSFDEAKAKAAKEGKLIIIHFFSNG